MIQDKLMLNIIEAKLLEQYSDYYPQEEYNTKFVSYLYKFLKDNTYSGKHYQLLQDLLTLKSEQTTLKIEEKTDKSTYVLTDDIVGISADLFVKITNIVKQYNNYRFVVKSKNRVVVSVKFGWLPPNAGSWLNLLSNDNLIDYYIDGITLRPNTHSQYISGTPDSGYVCYRLDSVDEFNTIMFLVNSVDNVDLTNREITFATLLTDIEGSKGATLNRIVTANIEDAFYEIGPYTQNYLSAYTSSLIIQIPYELAVYENLFYAFDVSNAVQIDSTRDEDPNDFKNYYVSFNDADYDNAFIKNTVNLDKVSLILQAQEELLDKNLIRYILGDFIWLTSDSKLIAYAQNLINAYTEKKLTVSDGVWNTNISNFIKDFKTKQNIVTLFDDDVLDITTEELLVSLYKNKINKDAEINDFFNEW